MTELGGVADVVEAGGLGGGTASGDGTEGLALTEERGEIEAGGVIGLGMRLVHFYHMRKWARFAPFFGVKLLKTIKATGGFWGEFAPFRRIGDCGAGLAPELAGRGPAPLLLWHVAGLNGRPGRRAMGVSGCGGVGWGEQKCLGRV